MDIEAFRKAGYQAIDRICDYYASMHERPVVSQVKPGYLIETLPENPPEHGEQFDAIADDFQKLILPGITHWQHPNFFAYFPTANTFEGLLGDLYSSSVANPTFSWLASPACTELEQVVMDWAAKLFGLGDQFLCKSKVGGGVIQTTASEGAIAVCVAARTRYQKLHPDAKLEDLVIYTSTQTHSLGTKAGLVLGLEVRALEVKAEDEYALRGSTLKEALEADLARGKRPFVVIATVGTTSSGAVDELDEIGEVLKDYPSIWYHVDAAWAGVAFACPEFRSAGKLDAVNKYVHSFCTNFHKWGLVNFDASALWVTDRNYLTDALDVTPEFLRTKQHDAGLVVDYRNWHLGLGRRFRSLKVWFVLRSYGIEGFQRHIRKGIEQNAYFASLVCASSEFELMTKPYLGLSLFRLKAPESVTAQGLAATNDLNRALYSRLMEDSDKLYITQTLLNGVICLRFAIGAQRTEIEHIDRAWKVIKTSAQAIVQAL
ncbi:pyridoxal phosphate-dependent transferase [Dichomitus squalens]|uniref:Pyridoxal phosphate-dependent transferase n=1 Tax=Dichomitus squalens TaxID=114155 RepID=A0A4Q9Q8J4_9APHY|nr:pyridoxal phosphate-dependent transferase [Dichomitus squalens]